MKAEDKAIRTIWFSLLSHAFLAVVKSVTGVVGHSFALIADGIESATDFFSSLLILLGLKYASKPADKNHPYGHGKAEQLITFLVVGFILASVFYSSAKIPIRSRRDISQKRIPDPGQRPATPVAAQ